MSPRVFRSLVAALIRIGLLLALVIMLMAEKSQAQPLAPAAGARDVHGDLFQMARHAPRTPAVDRAAAFQGDQSSDLLGLPLRQPGSAALPGSRPR